MQNQKISSEVQETHNAAKYLLELDWLLRGHLCPNQHMLEAMAKAEFRNDTDWIKELERVIENGTRRYYPLDRYYKWRTRLITTPCWGDNDFARYTATILNAMDDLVAVYAALRHFGRELLNLRRRWERLDAACNTNIERARRYSLEGTPEFHDLKQAHAQLKQAYHDLLGVYDPIEQFRSLGGDLLKIIIGDSYNNDALYSAITNYLDKGALTKAADLRELVLPCHDIALGSYAGQIMQTADSIVAGYSIFRRRFTYYTDISIIWENYLLAVQEVEKAIQKTF